MKMHIRHTLSNVDQYQIMYRGVRFISLYSVTLILFCKMQFSVTGVSLKWVKSRRRRRKKEKEKNTAGTAGGPGGRDRSVAVKSRKKQQKNQLFFPKK